MERLATPDLSEGMVLAEPVYCTQTGNLLLNHGTKLTETNIQALLARGVKSAVIAERFTLSVDPVDTVRKELKRWMESEINRLAPDKIEANTLDRMVEVAKTAKELVGQLLQDGQINRFLVEMKILNNHYLYRHSAGTAVLALLVSGAMDLPREEMYWIGAGALLHDLGICEMPMLLKTKKRNAQEEALWREHPRYGYYFAKEAGMPEYLTRLILNHHENWNGSGYPQGVKEEEIPLGSRIIAVCDVYDRLVHHDNYLHYQAIEFLYGSGNYYFDSRVVTTLTTSLAVYPLGSLVRLSTKEVGVVVNVRKNLGPRPIIRVFYNRVNRPLAAVRDVDLGVERTVFIEEVLS